MPHPIANEDTPLLNPRIDEPSVLNIDDKKNASVFWEELGILIGNATPVFG